MKSKGVPKRVECSVLSNTTENSRKRRTQERLVALRIKQTFMTERRAVTWWGQKLQSGEVRSEAQLSWQR